MKEIGFRFLFIFACAFCAVTVAPWYLSRDAARGAEPFGTAPIRIDFSKTAGGALPKNFVAVPFSGKRTARFSIGMSGGRRILVDHPGTDGDVLYYKTLTPLASLEESYSFVYNGPSSVVEPFIVNARPTNHGAIEGFTTNLDASLPGDSFAGNVSYRYVDDAGLAQNAVQGRSRNEPYVYRDGHTYRVDAILDCVSGLLGNRVYDISLGPQTFDVVSIKKSDTGCRAYPGIIARKGAVAVADLTFGLNGGLPIRPHPARRAKDYMNYLGYNAAIDGPATSPVSLAFQHYFPQLLIKHVRVPDETRFLPSLNAVARYGIDADVLTGSKTTLDSLRTFVDSLDLPPDAIELWNEPNNPSQGAAYDPQYASTLPRFAARIAQNYPRTKLWGPSVLPDPNGYPSDAVKLSASLGAKITAWNAHSYTLGAPENLGYGGYFANACGISAKEDCGWYGAPNYNDNVSAVINPSLPGVTTEGAASYGSYPEICGHSNVDSSTQQAYVERGMLYNFKLGHLRIIPYKFIDDGGCSDGFGTYGIMSKLVDANGRLSIVPKPAYVSLVYLDHLLTDAGATAKNFEPQPLAYALFGATPDVEELLLAESDGSYRLILWSDAALWDFNANGLHASGSETPLVAKHVEVTFAKRMSVRLFTQRPGTGVWNAKQSVRSTSIDVTIDQYPLVLAIATGVDVRRAIELPRGVPTPGPLETPPPAQTKPAQ